MLVGHFAFVLSALTAVAWCTSPWKLVSSRRAAALERRESWKRDIVPCNTIALHYAESQYHPPSAVVSLSAQEHRPILLLEDLDHLLLSVTCDELEHGLQENVLTLHFMDEVVFEEALIQWTASDGLVLITAHPGCNIADDRGTWSVLGMVEDRSTLRLTLIVERISLREVVESFAVKYGYTGARHWSADDAGSLSRRAEHSIDTLLPFGFNPSIAARLPLFPPNVTLNSDDPVSDDVINELKAANVDLTCVGCVLKTNVTVGLDMDVTLSDDCLDSSDGSCVTFNAMAMNLTVEEFEQVIDLEVFIGSTISKSAEYKIVEIPVGPGLDVSELGINLGPAVGLKLDFELEISSNINFTYGAQGHIPSGAFASVNLVDSSGSFSPSFKATGWDGAGVDQIPLRVNEGEFNITASVSLVPYAEIGISILNIGGALRLIQNVPTVTTTADMKQMVNRECKPLGDGDYESFDLAFAVAAGMGLSTIAELVVEKGGFGHDFPTLWNDTLWSDNIPFYPALGVNTTTCFVLSDDAVSVDSSTNATIPTLSGEVRAVLPGGHPGSTGVLVAAASAIPTFNVKAIESYFDGHGQLPTGVNYLQMLRTTDLPKKIEAAVIKAAVAENGADGRMDDLLRRGYWSFISLAVLIVYELV